MAAVTIVGLTHEQRVAVDCPDNLLLTACPGSGKTRTLIGKLVTEIEPLRGSPRGVCCITYTNSAAQEIEQRAIAQLQPGDERLFSVSTIHSFCLNEIVRPFAWARPGFNGAMRVLTRDNPAFESIARYAAAQVNFFNPSSSDFEAFEGLAVDASGRIIGMAAANEPVARAAAYYWARCTELGYLDFGSIIYGAYCLIRDNPRIAMSLCAKYAWFLVDEFQDTTELQIEILKLLHVTGRSRFFAVGDLAQSIYGFTGARPELVAPFGDHIGARSDLSLSGNFRSSQKIVAHAERIHPRKPPMTAEGPVKLYPVEPILVRGLTTFQAITERFLPELERLGIPLGETTILARDWASLFNVTRDLRGYGVPVVGPGARPYRRSRVFAGLAEQLCGVVVDPHPDSTRQLERALFHAVLDITGDLRVDVFTHAGRVVLVRLLREARRLAENPGALAWLDAMSTATGEILRAAEFIDREQAGMFYASAQEMKADMRRQNVDIANLTIDDLGLFASPTRALRLSTIHYAKGREYDAVALIGLRKGTFPHFRATDIGAEKRLFYVGVSRARKLLMYIAEPDRWGNPPSAFLGGQGVGIL